MEINTQRWFNREKGFGFIAPARESDDTARSADLSDAPNRDTQPASDRAGTRS